MYLKKFSLFCIFILCLFSSNLILAIEANSETNPDISYSSYEKAIITGISPFGDEDAFGNKERKVEIKFLSGDKSGETVTVIDSTSNYLHTNLELSLGEKVIVLENADNNGNTIYNISDYYRTDYLYLLLGLFAIILILVGGKKGFLSISSLIITLGVIFFGAIPYIVKGYSPILIAVLSSIVISNATIFMVGGFNKKSLSAILGTCFGTIIAGLIAYVVGNKIHLTGLSMDESQLLLYLPSGIEIHPQELLFAGIVWGSLGAVMDVGMSIASSIFEINDVNSNLSFKELFNSGMNVGRDVMATMSNTLILAYLGSSLPLILTMIFFNENSYKIINLDVISSEIVRSLSGSIGLILSIPFTALISSMLINKNK